MNCPACGLANRDDARFCGACGSATGPGGGGPAEAPVVIGREIAGRYRVLAKLGEGGMGAVFRAEQISLRRTVAVKLLRPEVVSNPLLLRRFNAEAEAVAKLSHPNTVNIYDFGQDGDGTLFIAMELIEGRSLRAVLRADGALAPRRALAIAGQVAASLADAHARSIVHRDLKPDNVMLQDRGRERDVARVLDFGIAKLRDDNRATQLQMTQQGDMLGTPQYMAPEQIRADTIDGRTDVYALGCMIYEMVTGRLPHEGTTVLALLSKHLTEQPVPPSQRRPELGLPPAPDAMILAAMAKDPAARPPTMEAFGEQIAAMLASLPSASASGVAMAPRGPAVVLSPPGGGPQVAAVGPAETPAVPSAYPARPYTPTPPPNAIPPYSPTPPGAAPPHSPTPPPYGPMPHGTPPYSPTPPAPGARPAFAVPAPPGRRTVILALAGVVLLAGAITAMILASPSGSTPAQVAPADAPAQRDAATVPSDPWADDHARPPPTRDPWGDNEDTGEPDDEHDDEPVRPRGKPGR